MSPELFSMLHGWLRDGDERQKRHAEHRLAQPDAAGFDPSKVNARPVPLRAVPPVIHGDPWRNKILACPDFQPGCCAHPAPFCTRYNVSPTREQCIECLGGNS